ncbi:hypothetical protein DIE15_12415 [Burkholderia sp. Bp9031]|uniref:hypothetical protein n=1 Tax=Burkholderia sp. Bp9031 TaxID=2184566 RepID=UPI000F5FDF72|nr:hypothetical protein [Burkholderia sp. Bp9031]RQZ17269.1 hypothetical protein DIE15_12415 [Burkholderia sp. Bp9031]
MSRSGYTDEDEDGTLGLWRGAVHRAISGKRGQAALRELAAALDAMPVKSLAAESLVNEDGQFCTLGALGHARGLDMGPIDPDDWDAVAVAFNIAPAMVREIVYENDEGLYPFEPITFVLCGPVRPWYPEWGQHVFRKYERIPEDRLGAKRWQRMRDWVQSNLEGAKHE